MTVIDVDITASVPDGSEILNHENYDPPDRCWSPDNLSLFVDDEQENPSFKGVTLLNRIKQRGRALGAQYLDWLLKNNEQIPAEWSRTSSADDKYIFFWATQYTRINDGQVFIRYLYQTNNGLWREGRHFLGDVWLPNCMSAEWKI